MDDKQSPICEVCNAWMLIHPSNPLWLKCLSCGFCKLIQKRTIIIPMGEKKQND
jgi:hypothetical protein